MATFNVTSISVGLSKQTNTGYICFASQTDVVKPIRGLSVPTTKRLTAAAYYQDIPADAVAKATLDAAGMNPAEFKLDDSSGALVLIDLVAQP